MTSMMWVHISGGIIAIAAGSLAISASKGSSLHRRAGNWFAASMLLLGVTATVLSQLQPVPEPGLGGLLTCYFVATSWMAARRRGPTGKFEAIACALILALAGAIAVGAITGTATTPVGRGPIFVSCAVCLLAGALDLNFILRKQTSAQERISRHLWRMCVAFFIATGSFFIGQQDVMPAAIRGSPLLFVLGFAPLAALLFWLVRMRMGKPPRFIRARPLAIDAAVDERRPRDLVESSAQ